MISGGTGRKDIGYTEGSDGIWRRIGLTEGKGVVIRRGEIISDGFWAGRDVIA